METTTAINSLIVINNDRYEGYKKAADEVKEADLKDLFSKYAHQSKKYSDDLRKFVNSEDEAGNDETKNTGKLFRVWMDISAALTSNDRKAILKLCEFGEDKAQEEYKDVLKDESTLPTGAASVVKMQKEELLKAHDEVKALRDSSK
jgi:uncharacterized protein (TIGR02284 family)